MTEVFSAERIDPSKLSEQQREEPSKRLYQVHKAVFTGLNEKDFDHYLVNSSAQDTRILLYRNKQKDLIGYFGVHRFEKHMEEQPISVFRGEVGLLPGYRQRDACVCFWLTEAAKFKLLNPRQHVYFLAAPVNPSSYAMLARHTHKLYPRHDLSIPSRVLRLMMHLAHEFGLEQVKEGNPLTRKVGWITLATDQEKKFWQSSKNPYVRFYIDNNPGFSEGNGLLTLIPLTITNTLLSLLGVAFQAIKKRFRV
ncbi:MAG: hypothetical protein LUQ29_11220 [Methylococcaceae bacterium]|nr:hypothetical protein [Methylococcaceae bacterium]